MEKRVYPSVKSYEKRISDVFHPSAWEETYTETAQDVSRKVRPHRTQRILLEHPANMLQLPRGLLIRLPDRPPSPLRARQIRPIHTVDVRVFGAKIFP